MDKEQYLDILKNNIKQSAWKLSLGRHLTFQHDNGLKHMAQIVTKYLEDGKIKVLAYPTQIPDLNHYWKFMVIFEVKSKKEIL